MKIKEFFLFLLPSNPSLKQIRLNIQINFSIFVKKFIGNYVHPTISILHLHSLPTNQAYPFFIHTF